MMVTIILLPFFFAHDPDQMLAIGDRIRMLRPKYILTDAKGPLAQGLCLCIVPLCKGEFGQVDKGDQGVGMVGAERLLEDVERLPQERLNQLVLSLITVDNTQITKAEGSSGMYCSERLFADSQGLLVEPFRLFVVVLDTSEHAYRIKTFGDRGMVRPEHLLAKSKALLMEGLGLRIEPMNIEKSS